MQGFKSNDVFSLIRLTHLVLVLPSYRNQSTDLLCKSVDWFLYESNTGSKWVMVPPSIEQ